MMKNFIFSFTIVIASLFSCNAQTNEHAGQKIKWMTFSQAIAANQQNPRKIFIDIYTGWCGWCKRMDATTFMEDTEANYMNEKFYAVKLDAEMKDSVVYNGYVFKYQPEQRANELAISLLQGKMSYPTFVIMDEKVNLLSPVPGYQTVPQIMPILKYFGDNIYLSQSWEEYSKNFKSE